MLTLAFKTQPLKSESTTSTGDSIFSQNPIIRVIPEVVNITGGYSVGHTFNVCVVVENVNEINVPSGLAGVEVYFAWNATLIRPIGYTSSIGILGGVFQGLNVIYGIAPGFFDDSGNPVNAPYTSATQYKVAAASINGPWWGNGTVVDITFQVAYQPTKPEPPASCTLELVFTRLKDENVADVTHEAENASYTIQPIEEHDIIVANLTSSKTIMGQGCSMQANVTIVNGGLAPETFNLAVYANTTEIGTRTVLNLMNLTSTVIVINGSSSSLSYGNYTISAYAWPVPGETNTDNNNCTGGMVTVTIPGDIDGDFKVDLGDLVGLALAYGSKPGGARWNPNADIDGNGEVGLSDLVIISQYYGQHLQ